MFSCLRDARVMNMSVLQRAWQRAQKHEIKLSVLEHRMALFRFFSGLILLGILIPLCSGRPYVQIFIQVVVFLFVCFLFSLIHQAVKKKLSFWKAIGKSYAVSMARFQRNADTLEKEAPLWSQTVPSVPPDHMYALDLDLPKELFIFLNTCSTQGGSEKLWHLLLSSGVQFSSASQREERQRLSQLLSKKTSLLRRFEALRFSDEGLKSEPIPKKNSEESLSIDSYGKQMAYAFFSVVLWFFLFVPLFFKKFDAQHPQVFVQPVFLYAFCLLMGITLFEPLVEKAHELSRLTKSMAILFSHVKKEAIFSSDTNQIPSFFQTQAAVQIKRMNACLSILSLRGNPVFWVMIHLLFPFDGIFSLILLSQFKQILKHYAQWQEEWSEFDVCVSFARLKSENPDFHFVSETSDASLSFSQMGHPLLPYQNRVGNSLVLSSESPLVLLTGSNMAGKSTFLRAFASNLLLKNMGAPVCAQSFQVPFMRILCAIRVDDSLAHGTSYFYAEVKRLAEIVHQLKTSCVPCLFFIDEIFKGTNNKERYLGSLSLLKEFIRLKHFGFISTHDLALADFAQEEPALRNMHFREHIEQDRLSFDYILREGPCPTTNALFIMKQAGLPILEISQSL
jgi:hypothetical protein